MTDPGIKKKTHKVYTKEQNYIRIKIYHQF